MAPLDSQSGSFKAQGHGRALVPPSLRPQLSRCPLRGAPHILCARTSRTGCALKRAAMDTFANTAHPPSATSCPKSFQGSVQALSSGGWSQDPSLLRGWPSQMLLHPAGSPGAMGMNLTLFPTPGAPNSVGSVQPRCRLTSSSCGTLAQRAVGML